MPRALVVTADLETPAPVTAPAGSNERELKSLLWLRPRTSRDLTFQLAS
uniref:Polyketide synthase n=1 Tax=Peronospora matthiolae TaxID=2874970 RepID=A0AAV1V223_9STRA